MIFNLPTELPGVSYRCHLLSVADCQLPGRPVWRACLLEPTEGWRPDQNGNCIAKQHDLTRCPWGRTSCYFHPNWAFCFCTRVTELNSLQLHTTSGCVYFPHVLSFITPASPDLKHLWGEERGFCFSEFSSYWVNIFFPSGGI